MGTRGAEKGVPGSLVLDAGALIACERGHEATAALFEQAAELGTALVVPASALAQAWRGGPQSARLSRLVDGCEIDSFDEARAKEVGARLGSRVGDDIADAHVVCCAVASRASVVTSDRDDVKALVEPGERLVVIAV